MCPAKGFPLFIIIIITIFWGGKYEVLFILLYDVLFILVYFMRLMVTQMRVLWRLTYHTVDVCHRYGKRIILQNQPFQVYFGNHGRLLTLQENTPRLMLYENSRDGFLCNSYSLFKF